MFPGQDCIGRWKPPDRILRQNAQMEIMQAGPLSCLNPLPCISLARAASYSGGPSYLAFLDTSEADVTAFSHSVPHFDCGMNYLTSGLLETCPLSKETAIATSQT